MEILLAFALIVVTAGAAWVVSARSGRRTTQASRGVGIPDRVAAERARRTRQRWETVRHMRQCYRGLQLALLNLREAPDFRRAAAAAQRANLVPVAFRQHQFRRFRPLLVAYLTSKLQRGGSAGQATAGLRELIAALGMPNFEADYILTEARGRTTVGPPPTFADQARQWQCEHQERLQAIRALPDLDPDVREQLTELEQERFRDQLMRSGGSDTSSDHRSSLRG